MKRFRRELIYLEKNNYDTSLTTKFYGKDSYKEFERDGCVILKEFEPFQMLEIVEIIYNWFDNEFPNRTENETNEILITLPEALYSLDTYMAEQLDKAAYFCSNDISEGIGFKKGYALYFSDGHIPYAFIFGYEHKEVLFIMFKKKDITKIHDYFFTSEVYVDRSSRGMA